MNNRAMVVVGGAKTEAHRVMRRGAGRGLPKQVPALPPRLEPIAMAKELIGSCEPARGVGHQVNLMMSFGVGSLGLWWVRSTLTRVPLFLSTNACDPLVSIVSLGFPSRSSRSPLNITLYVG